MFMMIGEETKMEQITEVLEKGGTIVVDRMDPEIDDIDEFVEKTNKKLEEKYGNSIVFEDDYVYTWSLRAA